ncbi:hypothetical protein [Lactobacillus xujianguonis]|uniref:hypothetical protein n=1 Tax=Lactobacillus xujianguonis TaxID=2495899 RepID=UPI000FDBFD6C|nr:hypothetical protein [Lactobacillus xujianguonis]RVU73596.1 hypothetical protein EJK20_07270 [Lactobacillus xujianguonis]
MNQERNDLEIANETMVMTYLNILKYVNHHCEKNQDPYKIADHVFTNWIKATINNQQEDTNNE